MYPNAMTPAVDASAPRIGARSAARPGNHDETRPHNARTNSRGIRAGTLAVRNDSSSTTPPTAVGGWAGGVTNGKYGTKRSPSGRKYAVMLVQTKCHPSRRPWLRASTTLRCALIWLHT